MPRFLRKPDLDNAIDKSIVVEIPRIGVLGVGKFFLVEIFELPFDRLGTHVQTHRPVRRKGLVGAVDGRAILDLGVFGDRFLGDYAILA